MNTDNALVRSRCVVLGAGGHAGMLIEIIQAMPDVDLRGILDADSGMWGKHIEGVRILGGDDLLFDLSSMNFSHFAVGVGSVGDNSARKRLYDAARDAGLIPLNVIHSSAIISPSVELGNGVQVMPGAIINRGTAIGKNVIVNSGAIVEHDCAIGSHVHVATGASLAGGVHVGDGSHIGAGATIRQGIRIGENAIVGMGAAVIKDVDDGTTVLGVPARPRGDRQ